MQLLPEKPRGRTGPLIDRAARSQLERILFFIKREPAFDSIDRYNFKHHQVVRLARLARRGAPVYSRLNMSRDGWWVLAPQQQMQSDLMLVDNFK